MDLIWDSLYAIMQKNCYHKSWLFSQTPYLDLPFFLEFGYFPISNFTKAPDQRTPATESDTNKQRWHQTQSNHNHSLLHSLVDMWLPWNHSNPNTAREHWIAEGHITSKKPHRIPPVYIPFLDISSRYSYIPSNTLLYISHELLKSTLSTKS